MNQPVWRIEVFDFDFLQQMALKIKVLCYKNLRQFLFVIKKRNYETISTNGYDITILRYIPTQKLLCKS